MDPDVINVILLVIVFFFGLSVGSFVNVCVYRVPLRKSIVLPRSFCPRCKKPIAWYDNIPILSYLLLKGRCRHCGKPISIGYPLVELAVGLLFVGTHWYVLSHRFDPILIPFYWYFCASLVALSLIDWKHYILPDSITYPLIAAGILFAVVFPRHLAEISIGPALLKSLLGMAVGGAVLWLIGRLGRSLFKKEAMGMGDVKLMAGVGAWQGWGMALFAIFIGALVASVVGVILIISKKAEFGSRIPFGPYLAIGSLITLFFGWDLLVWYLSMY